MLSFLSLFIPFSISINISNLTSILYSIPGRPGPGLTSCGVSQISDSEGEGESENDKDDDNHKDNDKHLDRENVGIRKGEKREKDRKKSKGEKSKEDERGETDVSISKHVNSTSDTSATLKDVKKRKSKGGSSSEVEVVVYDIRSDNEVDTDVVQVFPTQQSVPNVRSSKRKTSVEDLFYHTKEADRWDSHSQTPGIGAQSADLTTSKKKKIIDGEGSTKKKKTSHPAKNVPSSSDSDSSEDDYDGVVLRR